MISWSVPEDPDLFMNPSLRISSLSRFKVEDDAPRLMSLNRDPFLGWACIRLDRLATGYRFIQLLDTNGNKTPGVVLIRVDKKFH